jgi:DMSO/TMAO reductase YedYZ molybdopterin-dependent catalytic subunit
MLRTILLYNFVFVSIVAALLLPAARTPVAQPFLFTLSPEGPVLLGSQSTPAPAELRIGGDVSTPLVLTIADLKKMPRKTLSVVNPHDKKTEVYEGVLLEEILRKAGVPQGEHLRGASLATYVTAEASDGYRAVFSLAELDSGVLDSEIIVADTMDGATLNASLGPFRLVAPHEKRPARWVRMLTSITVRSVPK